MSLGASHVDSDTDTDVDPGLNRRPGRVKVTPRKNFGDSENKNYGYQKGFNKPKTTQLRVKNDAQDIESFKRIHTLIEEKKSPGLDRTRDRIWNTSAQEEEAREQSTNPNSGYTLNSPTPYELSSNNKPDDENGEEEDDRFWDGIYSEREWVSLGDSRRVMEYPPRILRRRGNKG
jgi:hypothetical protein